MLKYPQIPLHNNPAEIALRELVIKKKISYGTKSEEGRIAWENMMTIMDTCRKHNVSFMEYVKDIFSERYSMPRLSILILEKARVNTTSHWASSFLISQNLQCPISLPLSDKHPSQLMSSVLMSAPYCLDHNSATFLLSSPSSFWAAKNTGHSVQAIPQKPIIFSNLLNNLWV